MRTDRKAVNFAKQIARQKLEPYNGTRTGPGNFKIYYIVARDVQNDLNAQDYSLSEDELRIIVLDAMVENGRFQIGGTPSKVRFFRKSQIVLTMALVAFWIIGFTFCNIPSYLHFQMYFLLMVVSIGLPYVIFSMNKSIRSLKRLNILGK